MKFFGYPNDELELTVNYRQLDIDACQDFMERYGDLPRKEFIYNVISFAIANIDSEVRQALAAMPTEQANETLLALYNGSIMLNPVLDPSAWGHLTSAYNPYKVDLVRGQLPPAGIISGPFYDGPFDWDDDDYENSPMQEVAPSQAQKPPKGFSLTKAKLNSMPRFLKGQIIGQDEAIDAVYSALKRQQVGLNEPDRPLGSFIFLGPSGVGKSLTAKKLHSYLYDSGVPIFRIDCGEFQHKHENQKLIGSPAGYTGHEDGGFVTKMMSQSNGRTVVLLDEIEKAHPDFWDTWLKVLDEGYITDSKGNNINFRDAVIIMTSNLGNKAVAEAHHGRKTGFTAEKVGSDYGAQTIPKREMVVRESLDALHSYFKPEFLGRVDEIIVFNHLSKENFRAVADLEFKGIQAKLARRHFELQWTSEASDLLVERSSKAMTGARSMAKVRRSGVEDPLASLLMKNSFDKGKVFMVDAKNGEFILS